MCTIGSFPCALFSCSPDRIRVFLSVVDNNFCLQPKCDLCVICLECDRLRSKTEPICSVLGAVCVRLIAWQSKIRAVTLLFSKCVSCEMTLTEHTDSMRHHTRRAALTASERNEILDRQILNGRNKVTKSSAILLWANGLEVIGSHRPNTALSTETKTTHFARR